MRFGVWIVAIGLCGCLPEKKPSPKVPAAEEKAQEPQGEQPSKTLLDDQNPKEASPTNREDDKTRVEPEAKSRSTEPKSTTVKRPDASGDAVCQAGSTCPSDETPSKLSDVTGALVVHRVRILGPSKNRDALKVSAGNAAVAFLSSSLPDEPWKTIQPGANPIDETTDIKVRVQSGDALILKVGAITQELPSQCPFLVLYHDGWTPAEWNEWPMFAIDRKALELDPAATLTDDLDDLPLGAVVPITQDSCADDAPSEWKGLGNLERKKGESIDMNLAWLSSSQAEATNAKTFLLLDAKDGSQGTMSIEIPTPMKADAQQVSIVLNDAWVLEAGQRKKSAIPAGIYRLGLRRVERRQEEFASKRTLYLETQVDTVGIGELTLKRK